MVINSPCLTDTKNWLFQCKRHLLASPKQTALGKDFSNPLMADKFKNHLSDNEESLGEDASKQGRIDDADAEVTFIDETLNDARNKNNKISNSN
ncbi:hypothetical protein Tco_0089750 [Tanacetum coccineum]